MSSGFTSSEEAVAWAIGEGKACMGKGRRNLVVVSPLIMPTLLDGILGGRGQPMLFHHELMRGDLQTLLQGASSWGACVPLDLHRWSEEAFSQLVQFAMSARSVPIIAVSLPSEFIIRKHEKLPMAEMHLTNLVTLVRRAELLNATLISTPHEMRRDRNVWVEER